MLQSSTRPCRVDRLWKVRSGAHWRTRAVSVAEESRAQRPIGPVPRDRKDSWSSVPRRYETPATRRMPVCRSNFAEWSTSTTTTRSTTSREARRSPPS